MSQKYSPSEVSLHSSRKDCWVVIHGKVYNVTSFLGDHPGGPDVLLHASAIGEATQAFEDVGHSSTAKSLMQSFLIGVLDGHDAGDVPKNKGTAEVGATGPKPLLQEKNPRYATTSSDIIVPVLIFVLAFGALFYLNYYQPQA